MDEKAIMIPTEDQAKKLWDKYRLPEGKRRHVTLVANVAKFFATKLKAQSAKRKVNTKLLVAAALLHDIDKNAPKRPGERHPEGAVRILKEEGMEEVAATVKTHPLHAILDPAIAPKTWEEKLLFLADKMVKDEVIGVDNRFALWNDEHLPSTQMPRSLERGCNDERKAKFPNAPTVRSWVLGLPKDQQAILDAAYPKVKKLEKEVFDLIGLDMKRILGGVRGV